MAEIRNDSGKREITIIILSSVIQAIRKKRKLREQEGNLEANVLTNFKLWGIAENQGAENTPKACPRTERKGKEL